MAKLILTQKEKDTISWLDLDDDALGKATKAMALRIVKKADSDFPQAAAAAIILCSILKERETDEMVFKMKGLASKTVPLGDYNITVEKTTSSMKGYLDIEIDEKDVYTLTFTVKDFDKGTITKFTGNSKNLPTIKKDLTKQIENMPDVSTSYKTSLMELFNVHYNNLWKGPQGIVRKWPRWKQTIMGKALPEDIKLLKNKNKEKN